MQLLDGAEVIDRDHLLRTSLDLVAIGSPTGHEEEIGPHLVAHFSDQGGSVSFEETNNVVAIRPGTRDGTILVSTRRDSAGTGCGIVPFISDDGVFRTTSEARFTARFQIQSTDRLLETHMSTERSYRAMP